jgi:hypothetical protein
MVGLRRPTDAIDTVRDSLQEPGFDKPRQRAPGDTGGTGLLEGDEAPLPFGKVAQTGEWTRHAAKYTTGVILCSMRVAPAGGSGPVY